MILLTFILLPYWLLWEINIEFTEYNFQIFFFFLTKPSRKGLCFYEGCRHRKPELKGSINQWVN